MADAMDDPLVYLNGEFSPLSQAKISVLDRGFIFGDGVYEVIPVYGRRMFRSDQHLARLFKSLNAVGIANPHSRDEWLDLIGQVTAAHPAGDQLIYLQVTRGIARRAHAFPANTTPTVFIMANAFTPPSAELRASGIACVTLADVRWQRCDIKSISLLGNVLAAQYAVEHQAIEAIQHRDGLLTEGASSNVWIVKEGSVLGPPTSTLLLEGIRYGLIEELCATVGMPFALRPIPLEELFTADEVLVSSAGREILPVTAIDGKPAGGGRPGPVFDALYRAYQDAKASV